MPEIKEECIFEIGADNCTLTTQTNGDGIKISGIHLGQGPAATLAWLLNHDSETILEISIKVKD